MVDGPLGRRDASAPSDPRDEISSPSKHARRRANAAVSLPQLAAPPPPPPPPRTPPLEAVAEGDIHLSVSLPAAGGDGDGSATYTPAEHAGRRTGTGRQSSMKKGRLMDAAQQQMGEGDANFSVLTHGPPKLSVASLAGAASLLPEPPASGSGSRPLSPRAIGDQLSLQRELEARTKQLNSLFEQQLKSQYESMKSEASKLGRRHQP